jgi:hypothetical protein
MKLSFYLSMLILLVAFTSCKKDEPVVDYKEKYLGDYEVEERVITTHYSSQTIDTVYYNYQCTVKKPTTGGGLVIESEYGELGVQVAEDGTVSYCQRSDAGDFTNTGFIFLITNQDCGTGPNGWLTSYNLIGVKQ